MNKFYKFKKENYKFKKKNKEFPFVVAPRKQKKNRTKVIYVFSLMHSGSSINSSHPAISVSLGIASLVLEGRLISDEDFPNSDTEPPLFLERLNTVNDPVQDVHRIKQKLLQLRSCPGTSKDIVECPIAVETSITVTSADEHDTDDDLIYKNSFQQQPQIQVMQQQHQLQQQQQQQLQQHQQQQQQQQHDGTILDSLQFLATSCLKTTTTTPRLLKNKLNMGKNLATITTTEPTKLSNLDYSTFLMDFPLKFSQIGTTLKQQKKNEKRPKQGPHCEQFLKKFGVIKSEGADNIDELEHICNEAYNENCRRWNLNCTQIKSLINHGDPICIEVYLGPEINPILMEQWIIQLTNKPSHPTMNIQSLSSAIRSQLYFSQISSWTDLLKQQTTTIQTYNTEIKDNPRIKRKQKNNLLKSHLDILYRIKSYNPIIDLFTDKPLIHNFPDTIISDNLAIRVCLKSAPRFKEIPKLIDTYLMTTSSNSNNNNNNNNNNCPSSSSYGAGSSTSSSSSASSSASSSSSSMMIMDEHINMPCTEKGKHRCSYTNEQINEVMEIQLPTTQATLMQQQPITILSHREKQLIKYKKRLLKREKKKKVINNDNTTTNNDYFNINLNLNCCNDTITNYSSESINSIRPPLYTTTNINYKLLSPTTMLSSSSSSSTAVASSSSSSTSTIRPVGGRINGVGVGCGIGINGLLSPSSSLTLSIDTELYTKSTQTSNIDMMSVSTQTDNENINIINNYLYNNNYPKCNYCNNDMKCICWNCDKKLLLLNRNDKLLDNQERLLQSIQITPNYSIKNNNNNNNSNSNSINNNNCSKIINNNNNNKLEISRDRRNTCDLELKDCHLCKRQKTKHNTNTTTNTNINNKLIKKTKNDVILSPLSQQQQQLQISPQTPPTPPTPITTTTTSYRRTMSESLTGVCLDETKIQEQELTFDELKCFRRAFSEDVIDSFIDDDHDITCNSFVDDDVKNFQQKQKKKYQQEQKLQQQQRKRDNCVCRPNKLLFNDKQQQKIDEQFRTPVNRISYAGPIFVKCSDGGSGSSNSINGNNSGCSGSSNDNKNTKNHNYNGINLKSSIFNGRHIPKVNLTNIFNNGIPDEETEIEIFNFDNLSPNLINHNNTNIINNQNNHHNNPVQKSNSTPTLQNSSTLLSPRFLKSIALNKRRSRHLSERSSERSSIGSEEQLSDEEFGCGLDNTFSPVLSPNKICNTRSFGRSTVFGRLPLLGTLEESLLQRRFTPKFQVAGFKVLLGASGGFCPTQLTIPATTNLYELQGLTFTTPYVCEIRLPRKGYSIPPTGTVQTTLLNPQGTVVRMFVVPYDFRDMPNMSTTFIRQRILTYDESTNPTGKPLEQLSNAEQMKLLRYAIHLRFQRSRSGRLSLHTDIKLLISRRTDCDTAAAHAKAAAIESPNELKIVTIVPDNPKFSSRIDKIERKTIF